MRHRLGVPALAVMASGLVVVAAQTPSPSPRTFPTTLALTTQDLSELREWDARINALERSGELVLRTTRTDTLLPDRVHERYDQYVGGVRVFGGDIARQTRQGVTESVFGTLYDHLNIATAPKVSEDHARELLAAMTTHGFPDDRPIELVVLILDDGNHALTWRGYVWTTEGWMHTFIDATTGTVVLKYNDLHTQMAIGVGSGVLGDRKKVSASQQGGRYVADDKARPPLLITYDMRGSLLRADSLLNGATPLASDLASDSDNTWTDGANVDAHVYLGWTYDYLFKSFGRRGLDDANVPLRALTHPVSRSDVYFANDDEVIFYTNAFWCPPPCGPGGTGIMVFGEGLPFPVQGLTIDYFAGGLDVVAHELTHGLTEYTSGLIYQNESGALDESFSDVLGTSVEFFFQPPGNALLRADYLIGEDVIRPGGIRSMSNPQAFGDPDHYSRRSRSSDDHGGVHTNSSIPNNAFYLAIEGGVNRTSGLHVNGVGSSNREQIEKVFYRAFTSLLTSRATFSMARRATIQSARDLYGSGSPAERAVTEAWTAVGVH